ncbi:MAG: FkbM family methyltransferase [Rhodoferax sp.]
MEFTSYAQNLEDVMLWRALGHLKGGHYIDVGAQHPEVDSVSRAFYERGWRGVHVEPVPEYASLLRSDRPDEVVLQVAVANNRGKCEIHVFPGTGLSTTSQSIASRHAIEGRFESETLDVDTLTLDDVYERSTFEQIHWLKIDAEGSENEVLEGWRSDDLRPWIILIEATEPTTQVDSSAIWTQKLIGKRYIEVYFDGLNKWFISQERGELASAFTSPPNVFDSYVTRREVRLREFAAFASQTKDAVRIFNAIKLHGQDLARTGALDAAERCFRSLNEVKPDDFQVIQFLAHIDFHHGKYLDALRGGLRACELSGWHIETHCAQLAIFVRRMSETCEWARLVKKQVTIGAALSPVQYVDSFPERSYDVVVVDQASVGAMASESPASKFRQMPHIGSVQSMPLSGSLVARLREILTACKSTSIVFVNADALPLAGFLEPLCALEVEPGASWAFARSSVITNSSMSQLSGYVTYRDQYLSLNGRQIPDSALFEEEDVTAGTIYVRRAVLESLCEHGYSALFSIRSLAIHCALHFSPLIVDADVTARPASAFEVNKAGARPLLGAAYKVLLTDSATNVKAPSPRDWGLLPWALALEQGVAPDLDASIWLRLRQAAAFADSAGYCSHPDRGGVNFVGWATGLFGLSENMRAFINLSKDEGVPFSVRDMKSDSSDPASASSFLDQLDDKSRFGTSILFFTPNTLQEYAPRQLRIPGGYRIGYWFWECEQWPKEWHNSLDLVDEIWVASDFVAAGLQSLTDKPIKRIPPPLRLEVPEPLPRSTLHLSPDTFLFLFSFDFNSFALRKNPLGTIRAFRTAFADHQCDASLIIKSINGAKYPKEMALLRQEIDNDDRIHLIDKAMRRQEVLALMNTADCYVSLHRAEGLGLGLAESMYMGKPTIATAYSGNMDFMNDQNSCLVKYDMVDVKPGEFLYSDTNAFTWAEPDVEHTAVLMRKLYDDPVFRNKVAARGQADVRATFDPRLIGNLFRRRIEEIDTVLSLPMISSKSSLKGLRDRLGRRDQYMDRAWADRLGKLDKLWRPFRLDPASDPHPEYLGVSRDGRLLSCPCNQEQILSNSFKHLLGEMGKCSTHLHRKHWEWGFIAQALKERGMLAPGKHGLGFAVGQEPLPSYFASYGCEILATDLDLEKAKNTGWIETKQHSASLAALNTLGLISDEDFQRQVLFQSVDMNKIPHDIGTFDFQWSSCSFEHLGSIELGKQFIWNSYSFLRPGGIAVHTTEYNLDSDWLTMGIGGSVIFRRADLEEIAEGIRERGGRIGFDFREGNLRGDRHVDLPPYSSEVHLRLELFGYRCTSFGLIIEKP